MARRVYPRRGLEERRVKYRAAASEITSAVKTPSSMSNLSNSGVPRLCSMEIVTARTRRTTAIRPIRRNGSAFTSRSRIIVLIVLAAPRR